MAERISSRYRTVQKTRIALGPGQKSMQQVSEPLQTPRLLAAQGRERETEKMWERARVKEGARMVDGEKKVTMQGYIARGKKNRH